MESFYIIKKKTGQSAMETGLLVMAIVVALIAMQVYIKRAIQGHLRSNVESIGEQYDPAATTSSLSMRHDSNITTITDLQTVQRIYAVRTGSYYRPRSYANVLVTTTTTQIHYDNTTRTGQETVPAP